MKFIIRVDSFDDRSGGVLVLHLLCQRLAEAGETALIWPLNRPRLQFWHHVRPYLSWVRYHLTRRDRRFGKGPFDPRLASEGDLADAVVIYPEVVPGNPLKARHVVRWLLHRPGFHSGHVDYGTDDLIFYYQDAFYDPNLGDYKDNRLVLTWWNKEYRLFNEGERHGTCYLLKKGKGRSIVHDLTDSTLIDDLSHREKAEVFNRTRYFYTYDPYTLYARYAALCGCIPIIVPQPGVTRDQWVPYEQERYGLAYGEEEIGWAVVTRDLMLSEIGREDEMEKAMLRSFIAKCYERFS